MGGGDNFEQGVRTDFKKKMMLEQMLEGGAMVISGGRMFKQREE